MKRTKPIGYATPSDFPPPQGVVLSSFTPNKQRIKLALGTTNKRDGKIILAEKMVLWTVNSHLIQWEYTITSIQT